MSTAGIVLIGLLLGSIPFGYLVGRIKKIDIRKQGSGNVGATNVGRVLGPEYFALVFALDALKGGGAVLAAHALDLSGYYAGLAAIVGHVFCPFLGFRGGKGVATSIGVLLCLFPKVFVTALLVWIVIYLAVRYVSVASLSFALALPIFHALFGSDLLPNRLIVLAITVLIIFTHLPNIRRLAAGTEPRTVIWRRK